MCFLVRFEFFREIDKSSLCGKVQVSTFLPGISVRSQVTFQMAKAHVTDGRDLAV